MRLTIESVRQEFPQNSGESNQDYYTRTYSIYAARMAQVKEARNRKRANARMKQKSHAAEFGLRIMFPLLRLTRILDIACGDKSVPKKGGTQSQTRLRPLSILNTITALDSPTTFFSQSYSRPLYRTTAVQEAISRHMYIAASKIATQYANSAGVAIQKDERFESIVYAALSAVYNGYACVDGLFCDLFRLLMGESTINRNEVRTRNVVAYDVLRSLTDSHEFDQLKRMIAGNASLAATATVILLLEDRMGQAVGTAANAAAAQVVVEMELKKKAKSTPQAEQKQNGDDEENTDAEETNEDESAESEPKEKGGDEKQKGKNEAADSPDNSGDDSTENDSTESSDANDSGDDSSETESTPDSDTSPQSGGSSSKSNIDSSGVKSLHDAAASDEFDPDADEKEKKDREQTLREMQRDVDSACASAQYKLKDRATRAGIPVSENPDEISADAALDAMANSLDPESEKDSEINLGQDFSDGDLRFDPRLFKESFAMFKALIGTDVNKANNTKRAAFDSVKILDIWRTLGRVEGYMADAVSKSRHGDGEIVDVGCGNELPHMLPHEMLNLAIPEMRGLWASRFIEETLLVNTRKGVGESGAGPIVAMVDISGSMDGNVDFEREDGKGYESVGQLSLAKSFAIALARYAAQWDRKCIIVPFHSIPVVNLAAQCGGLVDKFTLREQLKSLCSITPTGGTDFHAALRAAAGIITAQPDEFDYADVIFFTDGQGTAQCDCASHIHTADMVDDDGKDDDNNWEAIQRKSRCLKYSRKWREDPITLEHMARSREDIKRECGLPEGVRTYALIIDGRNYYSRYGGYSASARKTIEDELNSTFTGDGTPLPHTDPDDTEHTNEHFFDAAVVCKSSAKSIQNALTRFYGRVISEAFYREF